MTISWQIVSRLDAAPVRHKLNISVWIAGLLALRTKGIVMSAATALGRRWKPIVVGVLLGAAEAFFINKVSSENPDWWWWLLLVLALVGVMGCAIWAALTPKESSIAPGDNTVAGDIKKGGVNIQQAAGAKGRNLSAHADNGSFAANRVDKIENMNFGVAPRRDDPKKSPKS